MPLDTTEQKQRLAALAKSEKKANRRDKIMTILAWIVGRKFYCNPARGTGSTDVDAYDGTVQHIRYDGSTAMVTLKGE